MSPAAVVAAAGVSAYGAWPRPLAPASTDEERARHLAFLKATLPDLSLWARLAPEIAD